MAISDKLDTFWAELTQRQRADKAKALLQDVRNVVKEVNIRIQEIKDAGSLDTLDTELKQVLNSAWTIVKDADAAFQQTDIKEFLDWRP